MAERLSYCFASEEGRYALFFEACIRGSLAGMLDFPHRQPKGDQELTMLALLASDALRPQVCCIDATLAYLQLVKAAYMSAYRGIEMRPEREIGLSCAVLKRMSEAEALAVCHRAVPDSDALRGVYEQVMAFVETQAVIE